MAPTSTETLFYVSAVCFPLDAPTLSTVKATEADSFLSPSAPIAARARNAHNAALQAGRLPWWRMLGEAPRACLPGSVHLPELEAELGGLFVGGFAGASKKTNGDSLDL